ncbi:MAG: minichromosome maintenance protein MCM [Aigarchaeota archaeon]|nr:minichromosome maintenance protein MCM [Aigarchaeota archaeon]MCX8192865.1 minichromosome maintenance protein MCM [Nitrososphaeria archaeon]MDW7986593.1 minichromosome maintenance protein MCM [Nitrososphaerota archaeon]
MSGKPHVEDRIAEFFKQEKYRSLIARSAAQRLSSIPLDFNDLIVFDEELSHLLVDEPLKYFPLLEKAAWEQLRIEDPAYAAETKEFKVRIYNLPEIKLIREIRASHLKKLIAVDGLIVRASAVKPIIKTAVFRCRSCGSEQTIPQDGQRLVLPESCISIKCRGRRQKFDLVEEKSEYYDYQIIGVQEKPEDLPPGQLPRSIDIGLRGDLVDRARPGDRVIVTGILYAVQEKTGEAPLKTSKLYLEAVSIETASKEPEALQITLEEEKMFREMASSPDIYQKLIDSIAPSIHGLEHIKKAIMLLLLGGRTKQFPDGVKVRGDIHVLLVGDPGTGKSQLLRYAAQIAPRGIYTSGRGSTAAGLTAAVVRDKGGNMILEAGALVLADMGLCSIDEIDKMRPEDRVAIHEAMAQQTVSIAKGGIVATLNARTSILAAANPELGRYNPYESFTVNVNLPITILSRFDLIFVLRDEPVPEQDQKIASHILSLQSRAVPPAEPPLKPEILRKYISYAKRIQPELTARAAKLIENFYLQMRSLYQQTSTITITARQLESLIRLAEARARAALREYVTEEDVLDVIELMKRSLSEVGIDIETGKLDIDVILTGKPKSIRDKFAMVLKIISEIQEKKGYVEDAELREALREQGIDDQEIKMLLNRLLSDGKLYTPKPGVYRLV